MTPNPVYVGEEAANKNAIVGFDRKRLNPVVRRRIKSEIERAVPEDSRDKGTIDTGVLNEATAENDLAIMLQFQGEYISTSADTRVE